MFLVGTEVVNKPAPIPQFNLEGPLFPEISPHEDSSVSMEEDETDPLAVVDLQSLSLDEIPTDESTRLMELLPGKSIGNTFFSFF